MISVVVPVYNVGKLVDRCIESLVNQSYRDIEIILVDDGSTDESGKICEKWAAKDSRVKVFHQKNQGPSTARNLGISNSKGEYLAFVDGDDFVEPGYIERMHEKALETDSDIVICNYRFTDESGREIENVNHSAFSTDKVLDGYDLLLLFEDKSFRTFFDVVWKKLYKRELFDKVVFPEGITLVEDIAIMPKLYHAAKRISVIDDVLYNYVFRENSISHIKYSFEEESGLRFPMMENRLALYKEWGIKELCLLQITHMYSLYQRNKKAYKGRLRTLQREFRSIYRKERYVKEPDKTRKFKFLIAYFSLCLYSKIVSLKS